MIHGSVEDTTGRVAVYGCGCFQNTSDVVSINCSLNIPGIGLSIYEYGVRVGGRCGGLVPAEITESNNPAEIGAAHSSLIGSINAGNQRRPIGKWRWPRTRLGEGHADNEEDEGVDSFHTIT